MLRHAPRWVSTTVSDDFQKAMANAVYTAMHGYVHDLHRLYLHVSDHCERVAAHHKLCSRDIAHDLREMWDRQACLGRELEEMRSHNALLRRTVVQMADDIHKCKQQLQDMRRRSTSQSALGTCQEPGTRTARTTDRGGTSTEHRGRAKSMSEEVMAAQLVAVAARSKSPRIDARRTIDSAPWDEYEAYKISHFTDA